MKKLNHIFNPLINKMKRSKLYGFDEHKIFAVYKKIWKSKSLSTKITFNQKQISPNWSGFQELISTWFDNVPASEKENARHLIYAKKHQVEIQSAQRNNIFTIFFSGMIPVLVMFVSIAVPNLSQKVETLDFPYSNTLYINNSDLANLRQDTKDILLRYGVSIEHIEESGSYYVMDEDFDLADTEEISSLLMSDGIMVSSDTHLSKKNNIFENFEIMFLSEYVIFFSFYIFIYSIKNGRSLERDYKKIVFYNDILKIIE